MKLSRIFTVVLVPLAAAVSIGHAAESKEFPELKCTVTPPGPSFEWLDHSPIPHGALFLANGDRAKLLLLTFDNPGGEPIDERFVKGFDEGFTKDGSLAKVSGQVITFCGVPCYDMRARMVSDSSSIIVRVFAANGMIYQLQLLGTVVGDLDQPSVDRMFSAFQFVGVPELPTPKVGSNGFSYSMGRLAGMCLLGALGLAVLSKAFKKKSS